MDAAANKKELAYRPAFSFVAHTRASIERLWFQLSQLERQTSTATTQQQAAVLGSPSSIQSLIIPMPFLDTYTQSLMSRLDLSSTSTCSDSGWTVSSVLLEHKLNQQLAPLGAARTLVKDVEVAISEYLQVVSIMENEESGSSRLRRRVGKVVANGKVALQLYSFAAWVALLCLQDGLGEAKDDKKELIRAVERTRMVVSTVSKFLTTNSQRAFKAADEYTKGKCIKRLILLKEEALADQEVEEGH
jgi:hypothetical protein